MSPLLRFLLPLSGVLAAVWLLLLVLRVTQPWLAGLLLLATSVAAAAWLVRPILARCLKSERAAADAEQSRRAAEEARRARTQLLASLSHELRTPLNGILGMTELVLDTELTPQQRDCLTTLQSSAESLLRLVNDILDLSKGEAGKLVLDPVEFSLRDALSETLGPLALRAQSKGLELAYHVQPRLPASLIGDVHRLQQILINLVGNAIKFTERGEIVVRAAMDQREGDIVHVHFSVADTGLGIPADRLNAIFQPFEQADASTTRRFGGTGLGLAITQQLTELMGGRIRVDSQVGRGSTFHVVLPLRIGSGRVSPSRRTQLGLIPELPVLVVDDNAANRTILEELLHAWELKPEGVADGRAALAALDHARSAGRSFGVVIIDADMPGMNGFELCRQIKGNAVHAAVPVIMLTAVNKLDDPVRALEAGAVTTLLKPVKSSRLARAIVLAVLGTDRIVPPQAVGADGDDGSAPGAELPRLRVLLADDNEINRKFGVRLLTSSGHDVSVADTGAAAVAAWSAHPFDVVLMDVQMPELDGYAATARIREAEAGSQRRTPIIGLTANVLEGERERCLAAGMDGYVAKPIRAALLYAEIRRVLGRLPETVDAPTAPPEPSTAAPFDAKTLLAQNDGDLEFLRETCQVLREDGPRLLAAIRQAVADGDAAALSREAHTLKGMVGNFCAGPAGEAARQLETLGREGRLADAPSALAILERELSRLDASLAQFLSSGDPIPRANAQNAVPKCVTE